MYTGAEIVCVFVAFRKQCSLVTVEYLLIISAKKQKARGLFMVDEKEKRALCFSTWFRYTAICSTRAVCFSTGFF